MHDHPTRDRCARAGAARWCRPTATDAASNTSMANRDAPEHGQRFRFVDQTADHDPAMSRSVLSGDPLAVDVHMTGANDVVELAELPLLLTIRQAAKVLGICPAKAYA